MENEKLDPTRWFVFEYPEGYNRIEIALGFEDYFYSDSENPYEVYNEYLAEIDRYPFEAKIDSFCLPYLFESEMNRVNGDAGDLYVDGATPVIKMIKLKKQVNDWIAEKRKELAELMGEQTPNTGVIQVVEAEIDPIVFERLSHKLVYLHEIGVYDFLAAKYKGLDKTPFATLVASMSGITDPKEIENLRKCISYIGIKDTKNPINKTSLKAVRAELLKIGISKLSN